MPGYEQTVTNNMTERARMYRLLDSESIKNKMSTDYEALLYMHSVSLVNPPTYNWFKIQLFTFSKYYDIKKIQNKPLEELNINEKEQLLDLKSWIYKKQD